MSVCPEKRLFNVDEYYRMAEVGILSRDERVELIEGEIFRTSPFRPPHSACVRRLSYFHGTEIVKAAILSIHNPVRLDEYSEPEPDIALLVRRDDFYSHGHPAPKDVLLVIEVADTSVEYDRGVKVPLYARAGIPEVWLAILPEDHLEAYSQPIDGSYQNVRMLSRGESLSPGMLSGLTVRVEDILG
jgi:Uma2 family endonuclease